MTERLQPQGSVSRSGRRRTPRSRAGVWGARTIPAATARDLAAESEPTLFGLPAEIPARDDDVERSAGERQRGAAPSDDVLPSDVGLATLRRADRIGGGALVLAGVAANVSLSLSWSPGEGPTGLSLVQRGVEGLGSGTAGWALSGVWQPFVVVLSGGLLVLLGFLLLVPARAHRLVGVLALVVSLAAATAVALLMADGGWGPDQFGPGLWCAVAVPILGTLGSLKAMLTAPQVVLDREPQLD
jgi:hypothetical protein